MPRSSCLPVFLFVVGLTGICLLVGAFLSNEDVQTLSLTSFRTGARTPSECLDITAVHSHSETSDLGGTTLSFQTYGPLTHLTSFYAAARYLGTGFPERTTKHHCDTHNINLAEFCRRHNYVSDYENINDLWVPICFVDVSRKTDHDVCLHTCPGGEMHSKRDISLLDDITEMKTSLQEMSSHRILCRKSNELLEGGNPSSESSPFPTLVLSNPHPIRPGTHPGRGRNEAEEQEFERFLRQNRESDLVRRLEEPRAHRIHIEAMLDRQRLQEEEEEEAERLSEMPRRNSIARPARRDRTGIRATVDTLRRGVTLKGRGVRFKSDNNEVEPKMNDADTNARPRLTGQHLARRGPPGTGHRYHHHLSPFELAKEKAPPLSTNRHRFHTLLTGDIICPNIEIPPLYNYLNGLEIPRPTVRTGRAICLLRDETICKIQCECGEHTQWEVDCNKASSPRRDIFFRDSRVQIFCANECWCRQTRSQSIPRSPPIPIPRPLPRSTPFPILYP